MRKLASLAAAAALFSAFVSAFVAAPAAARAEEDESVVYRKLEISRSGSAFEARLLAEGDASEGDVDVLFVNETVQFDVPNASFAKGKLLVKADDQAVKSVYVTETDDGALRVRFILNKGLAARSFDGSAEAARVDGALVLRLSGEGSKAVSRKERQRETRRSVAISDGFAASPEALDVPSRLVAGKGAGSPAAAASSSAATPESAIALARAAEAAADSKVPASDAKGAVRAAAETAVADPRKVDAKTPESQIMIGADKEKEKKSESDPIRKAALAAVALAAVLGGGAFAMKKLANRTPAGKQAAKIQVLGQHYLGPKKSLAIVHVAGESILIGITENSVSLIKTLALIDDEVPAHLPNRFDGALEDAAAQDDAEADSASTNGYGGYAGAYVAGEPAPTNEYDGFAMRGLSEIRDVVSGAAGRRTRR